MSQGGNGAFDKTFRAGEAMNTSTADYRAVYINSISSVALVDTSTQAPIGVLVGPRATAGTGTAVSVRCFGYAKVLINDTCTAGDTLVSGDTGILRGTGLSITAATSRFVLGKALETSGVSGTVIECLILPDTLAGTLSAAID